MRKVIVNLISLCIGIYLYQYMTVQNYDIAHNNSFHVMFGGLFVWFNSKTK